MSKKMSKNPLISKCPNWTKNVQNKRYGPSTVAPWTSSPISGRVSEEMVENFNPDMDFLEIGEKTYSFVFI